jgi:hypothetical protein
MFCLCNRSGVLPPGNEANCIVQIAYSKNIFFVTGAGNDDSQLASAFSPGSSGYAFVVGGYDSNRSRNFSSYGPLVDIFAPSRFDMGNGQDEVGTSLATPQVAAMLAKLLYERPDLANVPPENALGTVVTTAVTTYGSSAFVLIGLKKNGCLHFSELVLVDSLQSIIQIESTDLFVSSVYNDGQSDPTGAIDFNPATRFHSTCSTNNFFGVRLQNADIKSITIQNRQDCCMDRLLGAQVTLYGTTTSNAITIIPTISNLVSIMFSYSTELALTDATPNPGTVTTCSASQSQVLYVSVICFRSL